ncbi:hypothetical protein KR074_006209, partial [Drosophila pseudoananassae]
MNSVENDISCLNHAPNICGELEGWVRHHVSSEDTMTRLALRYDTSIGQICRANRMHWQDVLQTRHFIWVPGPKKLTALEEQLLQHKLPPPPSKIWRKPARELSDILPRNRNANRPNASPDAFLVHHQTVMGKAKLLPPHFYRQSSPNPNVLATEGDPLLITTKM